MRTKKTAPEGRGKSRKSSKMAAVGKAASKGLFKGVKDFIPGKSHSTRDNAQGRA